MIQIYVASAFSKDNKGGNKAGVVFDRPDLTAEQKMAIAKELGYSETAFVTRSNVADFRLEYFTPTEEVPLCGHATIATFSVLRHLGKLDKPEYTFEAKAGILRIRVEEDGMIFMEQNLPEYLDVLEFEEVTSCFKTECKETSLPVQIVSTGLRDILMPVESAEALAAMIPDFQTMEELSREKDVVGLHAFTLLKDSEVTAICRNFAPLYGIDEESATGTSNCALASYLFKYYEIRSQYVFEQGYNLGEVSRIVVKLQYEKETIKSVFVGGYGYLIKTVSM